VPTTAAPVGLLVCHPEACLGEPGGLPAFDSVTIFAVNVGARLRPDAIKARAVHWVLPANNSAHNCGHGVNQSSHHTVDICHNRIYTMIE
jgi:hypothetical protein